MLSPCQVTLKCPSISYALLPTRREDLHHIKSGEEDKRKFYRALCVLEGEVNVELMEKLQINEEFEIQQWTPLRVLHRRTLMKRPRKIFSVKAHAIRGDEEEALIPR